MAADGPDIMDGLQHSGYQYTDLPFFKYFLEAVSRTIFVLRWLLPCVAEDCRTGRPILRARTGTPTLITDGVAVSQLLKLFRYSAILNLR